MTAEETDNGSESGEIARSGHAISAYVSGGGSYDSVVRLQSCECNVADKSFVLHGNRTDGSPFDWKAKVGQVIVRPFGEGRSLVEAAGMPRLLMRVEDLFALAHV